MRSIRLRWLPAILAALSSPAFGGNLIVNGDFEAGNTGFAASSAYTYSTTSAGPGHYGVVSNPHSLDGSFLSIGDHTTGTGLMLVVDAANTSPPPTFWTETISVAADTNYSFTGFAREVSSDSNTATLGFFAGSTQIGSGFTLQQASQSGPWQEFSASFNSGSSTSITLSIADISPNPAFGNDFAVDDLSLTASAVPEPGGLVLLGIAAALVGGSLLRSRRTV